MMKRFLIVSIVICLILFISACGGGDEMPYPVQTESKVSIEVIYTPTPALINPATPTPIIFVTNSDFEYTHVPSSPTSTTVATPTNSVSMYSSYAYMVSFNPGNGLAEFDYFNLLQGDAAVAYLVADGCYTQSEAEQFVANMPDSDYLVKNVNPQLRTFNLISTPIKMLQYTNGYDCSPDPDPVLTNFMDLCNLYAYDHDLLLDSYFYYITVHSNGAVEIAQVWWP